MEQAAADSAAFAAHDFGATGLQEDRARLALEASGVGTWDWDLATEFIFWDENSHRLFGLPPGRFSGRAEELEKLIHPADREGYRAAAKRALRECANFDAEFRVVWPLDRSIHYLRARGKVYCDPAGQPARMTGAYWDISKRRVMEEELARERFFLRTLMEHIPDKIYFKDLASRFIWISRETIERFSTHDPADVLGKTDFDFFREEHAREAYDNEQEIIRTGVPMVNKEEHEVWADGRETWVTTTKMPLRDEAGRIIGTFGLSRDITARKKAEEQLARYAEELRRRNEELEDDLSMARELQNALMPRRYPCFPRTAPPDESALQFSHFFNPSTAVSGDFFDIIDLSDTMAGVFICDVMGHGVRAALVAAIVRALVGELKGIADRPGEFLAKLNTKLSEILRQTEIPMFASASYVVVDLEKRELRYANAGHPDPLRVDHKPPSAEASRLNHCKRGPVLGMFPEAEYGTSRCDVSEHETVLLFTDGLFEVEGADGALYDQQSLLGAVNRSANLAASDLCREVLAEIRQFAANEQFSDDVCLVALEIGRL
jgi:sigma-B regulation protein RsbU (phosphoserine phosphatase)